MRRTVFLLLTLALLTVPVCAVQLPGELLDALPEEAAALAQNAERAFVIGGGSIYRQMLPYCDCAYVTKVHTTLPCDTDFPNLDDDPQWQLKEVLQSGEENGIKYDMCLYRRAM